MIGTADKTRRFFSSGPMQIRRFRLLVTGQFTSTLGDFCYAVALPWLILSEHGGPVLLGAVLAFYGVPRVVAIPLGGVLSDRLEPRRIMLAADTTRTVAAAVLGAVAISGHPTLVVLAPIAVVLGTGQGLFMPASFAILPSILPQEELAVGNSVSTICTQVGGLLGPGLAGLLVATLGPGPALIADAISFAVSASTLFAMAEPAPAPTAAVGDAAAAQEQAQAQASGPASASQSGPTFMDVVRHGRLLHVTLAVAVIANLAFAGAFEVALPALAHHNFGVGGYGTLLAALSAGAITGAVMAGRLRRIKRSALLFAGLAVVMGAAISGVPYAGGLIGAVVCVVFFGAANGWSNVVAGTMLQVWSPPAIIGRVMSLVMLAVMGTFPVSVAVAGIAVRDFGISRVFPVAGCGIVVAVLLALTQPAFRNYRFGDHFTRPLPATGVLPEAPVTDAPVAEAQLAEAPVAEGASDLIS